MTGDIVNHRFSAYNIVALAAKLGGLIKIITGGFGILAFAINERVIKAKLIRSLYFIEKPKPWPLFQIPLGNCQKETNHLLLIRSQFYNFFWSKPNEH